MLQQLYGLLIRLLLGQFVAKTLSGCEVLLRRIPGDLLTVKAPKGCVAL
jgi:hypothetical protein